MKFTGLDHAIAHEWDKNRGTRYRVRRLYTLYGRQCCQEGAAVGAFISLESYNDIVEASTETRRIWNRIMRAVRICPANQRTARCGWVGVVVVYPSRTALVIPNLNYI